jgi:hypothetical protein
MERGTVQLTFEAETDEDVKLFAEIVELFANRVFHTAKIHKVVYPVIESKV